MFQDIYEQHDNQLLQHNQKAPRSHSSHFVNVVEGSFFHRTLQKPHFKVNSFHHQAVRKLAKGFRLSAISSDGIIESFESSIHPFVLGVQWHPECMIAGGDQPSQVIFQEFVKSCDKKTLVGG